MKYNTENPPGLLRDMLVDAMLDALAREEDAKEKEEEGA